MDKSRKRSVSRGKSWGGESDGSESERFLRSPNRHQVFCSCPNLDTMSGMSTFAKQKIKAAKESISKKDWVSVKTLARQVIEYEQDNYTAYVP